MTDSRSLSTEDAFRLFTANPEGFAVNWEEFRLADLRDAFEAGYALARSQSTEGDGEWDPHAVYWESDSAYAV